MVITETEEIVRQQRVNEHKTILDMIALLDKRLSKIENDDKGTARNAIGDKALLSKLNKDVEDNRKNLHFVESVFSCLEKYLRNHCKEETTNGKD